MMTLWHGVYVMLLGVSLLGPQEVCPGPLGSKRPLCSGKSSSCVSPLQL